MIHFWGAQDVREGLTKVITHGMKQECPVVRREVLGRAT